MSRKISIDRWLVMCARGVLAVHRYLVTMMLSTPRVDRNSAADAPAGTVLTLTVDRGSLRAVSEGEVAESGGPENGGSDPFAPRATGENAPAESVDARR